MALISIAGCDDGKAPSGSGTELSWPNDRIPQNFSDDVLPKTMLVWSYPVNLHSPITFKIYLGKVNHPLLYASISNDTTLVLDQLDLNTTYYWKIIATGTDDEFMDSEVWQFQTRPRFIFPFAVGYRWNYNWSDRYYNFNPDTFKYLYGGSGFRYRGSSSTLVTEREIIFDDIFAYTLHTEWTLDGYDYNYGSEDKVMYNTSNGLYTLYSDPPTGWIGPPKMKITDNYYFEFKGMKFKSPQAIIQTFMSDKSAARFASEAASDDYETQDLAYPLRIGKEWSYRSIEYNDPWNMKKGVVGIETVSTPQGYLDCFVIRWYWDINHDGQWDNDITAFDYLSIFGYVRREYHFTDLKVTDEYSQVLGTVDYESIYTLTHFLIE